MWSESDADEDEELDHMTSVEPGEKPSESIRGRMCPYCPKVRRLHSLITLLACS